MSTTRTRRGLRLTAAALAVTFLAACGGGTSGPPDTDDDGLWGTTRAASQADSTPLVDTAGKPFKLSENLDGKVNLVFFGYTNCPDICGIVMGNIAGALKKLEPEQRDQVTVHFVTTDPARDTGPVMREYLDRIDESFEGLTTTAKDAKGKADVKPIVAVGLTYGIAIDENPQLFTGGYDIIHSDQISGLTPEGKVTTVWDRTTTPVELAYDLDKLLQE